MKTLHNVQVCVPTERLDHIRPQIEAVTATYQGMTSFKAERLILEGNNRKVRRLTVLQFLVDDEQRRSVLAVVQRLLVRPLLNAGENEVHVSMGGETRIYERVSAQVIPFPGKVKVQSVERLAA